MNKANGFFKHSQALVETDRVGGGTRVWAFAHIMAGATIGVECNVCDHAFIEANAVVGNHVTIKNGVAVWDGVVLEDYVFVGPNVVFTNDKTPRAAVRKAREALLPTYVRYGASIGANATIICGVTLGRHSFIGAGAVVTRDVVDYGMVVGNPARHVGYRCECGAHLTKTLACRCGRRYQRNPTASGLTLKTIGNAVLRVRER